MVWQDVRALEPTSWVGTPKSHKQVAGKTTSILPLGTTVACRGVLGVADTGVRQQSGANIFSYITTLQLHRAIQPLSVFVRATPDIKERRWQSEWVISNIQLLADLPPGMAFEVPSYMLVTWVHTKTYTMHWRNTHFTVSGDKHSLK